LTTPIPQIEAALGGLIEWHNLRHAPRDKRLAPPAPTAKPDRAAAARSLAAYLRSRMHPDG
jgi:hypothetical protein